MSDPAVLSLYLVALVAVYLAPGPDMALVVATSAARGARAGLRTALGLAAARSIHVTAAGAGLAALFAAHPTLHTGVRAAGATYLLWLAWKLLRPGGAGAGTGAGESAASGNGAGRGGLAGSDAARGFLTNLLNPKALLFCGLLLPQFARPEQGGLLLQYAQLGGVLVAVGFAFDAVYALLAGGLARRFAGGCAASRGGGLARWLMGSVFAALAARLLAVG
jgi:threonine/homoserine/homoserine lactone efflux protein